MYLTQGLHRGLQQTPDAAMTVYGDRTRTFREVADRVARLAGALRGLGVTDGDRVAMLSLNSDRYHEYLLAVPWANAVLNPVNVRWSAAEIGYSLQDSATTVLLVDDAFVAAVPAITEAYPGVTTVIHCGDGPTPPGFLAYEQLIAEAQPVDDARRGGDELAGLFYTGGTTGEPKGVMLSHTAMVTSAMGAVASGHLLGPAARYLHAAPMFHLADLAGWTATMLLGGIHVIVPRFEPAAVLSAIQEHAVTDVALVPTMVQLLVEHPDLSRYDLSSVRAVLYGASPMPQPVLDRATAAFPHSSFTQIYGMTELAPIATMLGPEDHRDPTLLRSAGRALPHTEVRIVDTDGVEVPPGTVGEIVVRGANVMLGYWNKPAATALALRDGWLHTGDGGFQDDRGYVFVVDRIKDMIVTGGENVYSTEVENAVVRHPAVAQCAVIGIPDERWGERVHAVVTLRPGHHTTGHDIREHTKSLIAGYKAPRSVDIVDALPTSAAGKILKRELRSQFWPVGARQVN